MILTWSLPGPPQGRKRLSLFSDFLLTRTRHMAMVLATTVPVASLPELLASSNLWDQGPAHFSTGVSSLTSNRPRVVLLGFGNVAPDAVPSGACHQSSAKVLLQEEEVIKSPLGILPPSSSSRWRKVFGEPKITSSLLSTGSCLHTPLLPKAVTGNLPSHNRRHVH